MSTEINILEKELIDYSNSLLNSYEGKFKELDIVVKEYPRIDSWESVRNFVFYLWKDKSKDFLLVEFPTFVKGKPFCTLNQAQEWIKKDIQKFLEK